MVGNDIIVNPGVAGPHGRIEPSIISGTPKPGTCMQMKAATAAVSGKFTFEVFNLAADGDPAPVAVLLSDDMIGRLVTTAYTTGTLGDIYWPCIGDELNMLVDASLGDIAIGDKFSIDDGTGKLIAGASAALTFQALEAVSNPSADVHVHCRCIRNC